MQLSPLLQLLGVTIPYETPHTPRGRTPSTKVLWGYGVPRDLQTRFTNLLSVKATLDRRDDGRRRDLRQTPKSPLRFREESCNNLERLGSLQVCTHSRLPPTILSHRIQFPENSVSVRVFCNCILETPPSDTRLGSGTGDSPVPVRHRLPHVQVDTNVRLCYLVFPFQTRFQSFLFLVSVLDPIFFFRVVLMRTSGSQEKETERTKDS